VPDDSFPQGWLRDPGTPPNLFDAVIRCGSRLCAQGQQGTAPIDPLTLAILR
jgi:hypothetical protein